MPTSARASSELDEIDTQPYNMPSNQTPTSKLKGLTPEQAAEATAAAQR